jgi:hypothetical protein
LIRPSFKHVWDPDKRGPWASWCRKCRIETTDLDTCRDCRTSLQGQPTRGPFDPELTPSLVKDLLERAKEAA